MEQQTNEETQTPAITAATSSTKNTNTLLIIAVLGALVVGGGFGYMIAESSHGHMGERYGKMGTMMEERDIDRETMRERMEDRRDGMHDMHDDAPSMSDMMHDMNANLEGKTGAEFDAAFLSEMIVHHQGAIDMAKLALEQASDPRIKTLAEAIIAAQTAEIADMESWQAAPVQ